MSADNGTTGRRERACVKCGQCMSVCPVFKATHDEADVARGKLAVLDLARGKPDATWVGTVENTLSRCLQCGACEHHCANRVRAPEAIRAGRRELFRHKGHGALRRVQLDLLTGEGPFPGILRRGGSLLEGLFAGKPDPKSGLYLRFPLSYFTGRKTAPGFHHPPFTDRVAGAGRASARGSSVVYFAGCGANHLHPGIGDSLLALCEACDIPVAVPRNQGCCGMPHWSSGDVETARELARRNMKALAGDDRVVATCASCAHCLRSYPEMFEPGTADRARAEDLSGRVADACEMVGKGLEDREDVLGRIPAGGDRPRVYYHEPCHLRFGPAASTAPRELLESMEDRIELVDSTDAQGCCGHGGSFNLSHLDLSNRILDDKFRRIAHLEPDRIVSGCTGCLLQLTEGAARSGLDARVCHPLEILADYL
ncbi:MAG: (Fe-S)-binding protein [Desulfatibacillaceae bacterium]